MREQETQLAQCADAPEALGIGRGTGCTFKAIREALRAVGNGGGGITHRVQPSRHWVRSKREAANRLRGLAP